MMLNLPIRIFIFITIVSFFGLIYITNEKNNFFNNPLSDEIVSKIDLKRYELEQISNQKFGVKVNIPVYINDTLPNQLFGLATVAKNNEISIVLNKNHFKENERYMIEEVLPHEYAHALMFVFGDFSLENGGHSQKWQNICNKIGGKKCERFANSNDILIEKIRFGNNE